MSPSSKLKRLFFIIMIMVIITYTSCNAFFDEKIDLYIILGSSSLQKVLRVSEGDVIRIYFVNSVTHSNVAIYFLVSRSGFIVESVETDQAAEEYYTSGLYSLKSARGYTLERIDFCTAHFVGISILRSRVFLEYYREIARLNVSRGCVSIASR